MTAPILIQREATQHVVVVGWLGWSGVPGQGTEVSHLLGGGLGNVQGQRPLRLRLPSSCKEVGQGIR